MHTLVTHAAYYACCHLQWLWVLEGQNVSYLSQGLANQRHHTLYVLRRDAVFPQDPQRCSLDPTHKQIIQLNLISSSSGPMFLNVLVNFVFLFCFFLNYVFIFNFY